MKNLSVVALLAGGLLHLLPVSGVMGAGMLEHLYGIVPAGPDIAILLQHRALLFGALGVLMLVAIALRPLRIAALSLALFSAAGFPLLAAWVGGYNAAIGRVVVADLFAVILLSAGLVTELRRASQPRH
jgi:hypothetical protein